MTDFLERLYPYVPVWAQNFGISLYGLRYRSERLGREFPKYLAEFQERDHWSQDRMHAFLETQLRSVSLQAFDHVPYYREKWRAIGITRNELLNLKLSDLPRFPMTPKADLRRDPHVFLNEVVSRKERLHRYYSSGSTGTPVTCLYTSQAHRRFFAAREVRSFGWAGASILWPRSTIGGRMVVPRADGSPPYYRRNWAERQVYFSAYHISPNHVRNYIEGLNRYRPRVLTGYAYSHYLLARLMLDQNLRLDYTPDALILCAEKLTSVMKNVIRQAFQARAYEEYSSVEQCVLATECEHGSLHVNSDFGIVEIVDERFLPVAPGKEGRVLCTGLLNDAQLLVRYEIGDLGMWSTEKCGCGRDQLPVLKQIVGRLEDAVVAPDGREMVRFHGLFINLPHVIEGQVIQEQLNRLLVKVVTTSGFGQEEERLIRRRLTVERMGDVSVQIERVRELERTEKGKFRAVICRLSPEERTKSLFLQQQNWGNPN